MKLKNKKTGEIIDLEQWRLEYYKGSGCIIITNDKNQNEQFCYMAFADMKDEWEDYEPLIKDENVRALVRNWLMLNKVDGAFRHNSNALRDGFGSLLIVRGGHFEDLDSERFYTIDELCGTPEPLEPTFINLDERIKEKEKE